MENYPEEIKALALRYVVEKFGDDMDAEEAALLMEVWIDGYYGKIKEN